MKENFVLNLLKSTVTIEIENYYVIKDDCIEITLPNGDIAILTVLITDKLSFSQKTVRANDYVFNHDYSGIGENLHRRLLLRNAQDVEDYAIDVSQENIIDVKIIGNTVVMPHEPFYEIAVEIKL